MRAWVLLVAVAVLLSGCASQPSGMTPSGPDPSDGTVAPPTTTTSDPGEPDDPVEPGDGEGTLVGHVVDDELKPVAGANVTVSDLQRIATSRQDGSFVFDRMPVGTWTLVASAAGYEPAVRVVTVDQGETVEVSLQVSSVPATGGFYVQFAPERGVVGCAVGVANDLTLGLDRCRDTFEGTSWITFQATPGVDLTGMQTEIVWESNSDATGATWLRFDCTSDVSVARNTWCASAGHAVDEGWLDADCVARDGGPSPVVAACTIQPVADHVSSLPGVDSDFNLTIRVTAGSEDRNGLLENADPVGWLGNQSGLVFMQSFELYHTQFFGGAPIPDGYQSRPEA